MRLFSFTILFETVKEMIELFRSTTTNWKVYRVYLRTVVAKYAIKYDASHQENPESKTKILRISNQIQQHCSISGCNIMIKTKLHRMFYLPNTSTLHISMVVPHPQTYQTN